MSFETKRDKALSILAKTDIPQSNYLPSMHSALWKLGVKIPPPHFARHSLNLIFFMSFFALLIGICANLILVIGMWLAGNDINLIKMNFHGALIGGALFGVITARSYEDCKRKYKLPTWKSLD